MIFRIFLGGWKTRETVILHFLDVDNFDFTRKNVEKKIGWKTREKGGGWHFSDWQLWFPEKMSKDNVVKIEFWTKTWLRE